jgi:hypothetical protein
MDSDDEKTAALERRIDRLEARCKTLLAQIAAYEASVAAASKLKEHPNGR